jgi:predicted PurR-regulated permease PerM
LIEELREAAGRTTEIGQAAGDFASRAVNWALQALGGVISGGLALVNILSLLFITPVVTFYLLRDWDRVLAHIDALLPREHAETIREQARLVNDTLAGFVRGQATVCFLLGTFYAVALSLAGLNFGLVIGLVSGILSFIPYVGTIFGFVAASGLALAQFDEWYRIAIVIGIFLFGQFVEGNFLTPKLVGDRVRLHPVWVIFALLAGGTLFGFAGVLLAVPVAAVIGVLTRFAVSRYTASPLYGGTGLSEVGFRPRREPGD